MGRRVDVQRGDPPLPEHRRRHARPLGQPRDPSGRRRGHERHLQDPGQRCRRDDRGSARGRGPLRACAHPPARGRGRGPDRCGHRRPEAVRPPRRLRARREGPRPQGPRRRPARAPRGAGRDRAHLRPGVRGRPPPRAQARTRGHPRVAGDDQRGRLRGLRRLRRGLQLPERPPRRHPVRSQDPHPPGLLQSRHELCRGRLPGVRHCDPPATPGGAAGPWGADPHGAARTRTRTPPTRRCGAPRRRHRRHGRRHRRSGPVDRGEPRGARRVERRPDRHGPEGRAGRVPPAHRRGRPRGRGPPRGGPGRRLPRLRPAHRRVTREPHPARSRPDPGGGVDGPGADRRDGVRRRRRRVPRPRPRPRAARRADPRPRRTSMPRPSRSTASGRSRRRT